MKHESPFKVLQSKFIPSVRSTVTRAIHHQSGAEFFHIECPEERENFFSACFRTPPADDKGTPHITEHTVLCGSEKYPVKDPFMEMVKSSMATFINAITYGDRTIYPCGSLNTKDFKNLVSIYMDAVFHPLLTREHFLQEGYRLDFEEPGNPDSPLIHNGVVYNEMKGAYSDPDSYIERELSRFLYPEGSDGKDSGGDPLWIPSLTYEEFRRFHAEHYHPSNCCLFALTNIPFDEMADFLHLRLSGFKAVEVENSRVIQPGFSEPVRKLLPVPGSSDNNCTVTSAWITNTAGDPVETLAFSLLEDVLLDDDSSPVKAALLDSGLGTGLSGCGYDSDPGQRNFVIGLKGVKKENADGVFNLIHSTLQTLSANGLDHKLVKNMLHRKELSLREIGSNWPFSLMSTVSAAWTHREDVLQSLDLNYLLNSIKQSIEQNPGFLEGMIQQHLIQNTHRIDCLFHPDEDYFAKQEKSVTESLKRKKQAMSQTELAELADQSQRLAVSMNTPSTPEALATLPKLSVSDVSQRPPSIFHTVGEVNAKLFLPTEIQTAGICYADICFDMSELPLNLIAHLPFFASFLTKTGAAGMDYIRMAEKELACSGGIGASNTSITSTVTSTDNYRIVLKMGGHCLEDDLPAMLEVMENRLFSPDLNNPGRIAAVASEISEHARSTLVPRGNVFASLQAQAGISAALWASNQLHGIPALKQISSIGKNNIDREIQALEAIHNHLTKKAPQIMAWSGPPDAKATVTEWFGKLPGSNRELTACTPPAFPKSPGTVGVNIKAGTSFAAAAMPGLPPDHPLYSAGIVMMRMLSEGYLWQEIRVLRGAYGAGSSLSGGTVSFFSYRDPSPQESLKVFKEAIKNGINLVDLNPRAIEDSIIASVKGMDPAVRPSMANGLAILRQLMGISIDIVAQRKTSLLSVNRDSITSFAELLKGDHTSVISCVAGNKGVLESVNPGTIIEL